MMDGLVIDCFAGGGGASTGIEGALNSPVNIAVNHDPLAIAMHKANHPNTLHLTEDIFTVDLAKYVGGRHVSLMWASPDCTSHSRAKGAKPCVSGLRMLPWAVHQHASVVKPDVLVMENVAEIQKWGPLGEDGRPIKKREGEEYAAFVAAMRHLGYTFESREITACDFGAPTTRKRWYAILRRDGKPTVWPKPTHGEALLPYGPASTCIDFSDLGTSIFERKKPLAENTLKRIARGVHRYVIEAGDNAFVIPSDCSDSPSTNSRTCSADKDKSALVSCFLQKHYTGVVGQGLEEPMHTITAGFGSHFSLVSCYLTKFYGTSTGQSVEGPMHTITTSPGHFGLVSAFLVKYYGCGTGQPVNKPLGTITTKDRFALVTVEIDGDMYAIVDIRLRMLKPRELMLAQGFPASYNIDTYADGSKVPVAQQVKMIGNSVSPPVARALVAANCATAIAMEVA